MKAPPAFRTGKVSIKARRAFRSFKVARAFVRGLNLKSREDWLVYCASKKPADIPYNPHVIYAHAGWGGTGDWLGTGTVSNHAREFRSFKAARAYVHSLKLKSKNDWLTYCASGKRPADIPSNPNVTYADAGWVGMRDFLGTEFRSFKAARAYVRSLKLKSKNDWLAYCTSGKKPADIPSNPNVTYADAGWVGMVDWLGYRR